MKRLVAVLMSCVYVMNLSPGIYAAEARSAQNSIRVAAASGEGRVQEGAGGAASEERGGEKAALQGAGADKEGQKASKLIQSAAGHNKEEKASRLIVAQEGGFVELGGARIDIPEGALKEDTEISIRHLDRTEETGESLYNVTAGGGAYRFEPAGLKFLKEVEISIAYTGILEGKEASIEDTYGYFYDVKEKKWVRLERKSIEKEKRIIHSITTHFTDMINATLTLPETANSLDFNINSIKELEAAKADAGVVRIEGLQADSFADANFQMQLDIPQGRDGMKPSIRVVYSSGAANGIVGKGFDIRYASSITTDTRWGVPAYNTKDDRYMLDGILLKEIENTGNVIRYEQEKQTQYRLIERVYSEEENYWRVTENDGKEKIYGKRYFSGKDEKHKYSWHVEKETDIYGNTIEYEYVKESGYVYPEAIYYTGKKNRDGTIERGKYSVVFSYEDRADERIDMRGSFEKRCKKRVKWITTYYDYRGQEDEEKIIKRYAFTYNQLRRNKESVLASFCVYGKSGKEKGYEYTFEYEDIALGEDESEGQKKWGHEGARQVKQDVRRPARQCFRR